jgi:hypothetical protein
MTDVNVNQSPHDPDPVPVLDEDAPVYCTVHPDRETALRCNKCGRPMCVQCAVKTPVGYRCRECVRGQQDVFFTASTRDYVIAGAVSFVIALVAGYIINAIPFFLLAILAGPVVGGFIAQMVLRFTGKRRGRYTGYVVVAGILAGILPSQAYLIELLFLGLPIGIALQGLLWPGLFAILTASVAFGWFRYGPRI